MPIRRKSVILERSFAPSQQWHQNKRFLIVDDEPYNLMGLKIILAQAEKKLLQEMHHGEDPIDGYMEEICDLVDQASNGKEAVEAVIKAH